jgi:hypothetical protein
LEVKTAGLITTQSYPRVAIAAFVMPQRGRIDVLGHGGDTIATFVVPNLDSGKALKKFQNYLNPKPESGFSLFRR